MEIRNGNKIMNWTRNKIKVVKIKKKWNKIKHKVLIKYELLNNDEKKWWLNF